VTEVRVKVRGKEDCNGPVLSSGRWPFDPNLAIILTLAERIGTSFSVCYNPPLALTPNLATQPQGGVLLYLGHHGGLLS
jgi:hypothetical protein